MPTLLTIRRSFALFATGVLLTTAAHAQPTASPSLGPLTFSLRAQASRLDVAGTVSSNAFFASGGGGPTGPTLAVHGEGLTSRTTADNGASAQSLWSFQIVGPEYVDVPILITGLYRAAQTNAAVASGGLALGQDRFRLSYAMTFRCIFGDESGCDTSRGGRAQDFVLHESAVSGRQTFILIATGGSLGGNVGSPGSFSASIDPLVSIDPAFGRASEFTVFVSTGAEGSVAPVPEPETYSLMLAGLAVTVALGRRRARRP